MTSHLSQADLDHAAMTPAPRGRSLYPTFNNVLVKRIKEEGVSKGGIIIPDSATQRPTIAEIIAVGPGKVNPKTGDRIPVRFDVGMVIMFGKYAGTDIEQNGSKFTILKDDDIICIIG